MNHLTLLFRGPYCVPTVLVLRGDTYEVDTSTLSWEMTLALVHEVEA